MIELMSYDIDLRMPKTCGECGYACCAGTNREGHPCYRPIFSGEYCSRNARGSACRSFPLDVVRGRFAVLECQGYRLLPASLFELVERLNKLGEFDAFSYSDDDLSLAIKRC